MLITGNNRRKSEKNGSDSDAGKMDDQIDGEDFVIGMAASELSYAREEEALKAWVIVCRTNFVKAVGDKKGKSKQRICRWITFPKMNWSKIMEEKYGWNLITGWRKPPKQTFGQVLCYGGSLIDALYHPVSIGKTVSASEIYSVDVPYLISVDSSQDVESRGVHGCKNSVRARLRQNAFRCGVYGDGGEL